MKTSRGFIEKTLLIVGLIGLALIIQPFSRDAYTWGWYVLMAATTLYVASTLTPTSYHGTRFLLRYALTLTIVLLVVASFILLSIKLAPLLVG
ncbi:hypothetical protein [Desulfurococcus mucosus]|uniref:Uncharacterized protein n=1 Tax=Desulfurococcus mucosus (strain ATCC 35584 / DSM 2162 / JCM 9187 / O7/1) TaxID=765177 RepID=E8R8K6_DESM0|nr:hypothetical protein [Desulfurococcus mucosus]ADV64832.1 hypothetical protein Desmu_0520 [Desulfurococcus mucosus DSM 2162]